MDAAVDSVESAGIACTMTLEQALFDAANGMCRNLLDALLASEAAEEFSKTHGFFMGKDAVMSLARRQSQRVSSFLNSQTPSGGKPEPGEVVCVEGDGTGIRYRRKHMRGVKGRNGRAKTREAKVGAIFIGGVDSGNEPFRKSDSTTYTATTEKWESYGRQLRREFDRRFREKPSKTLFLTDGGKWLRSVHRNFFPFAEPLLDFYHAAEHLKALLCAMGMTENTKAFKRKFKYHRDRMRDGKIDGIINWARKEGSGSEAVEKELNYFRENKSRMKYDEYIAKGWYIGSGVIEAGCKTVVCQRFKQPGMFWSPKSTKPLLPLRALLKSNRLCEYSNFLVKGLPQVDIQSKPA